MQEKEIPTLTGDIVTLRKIDPERDRAAFYKMFLEPDMHLWTGNRIFQNQTEAYEELRKYRDLDQLMAWAIIKNETQEFIGTYWVAPTVVEGKNIISAEAQRINKSHWRKGYTKASRHLVYEFVFTILEVEEVHAQAWENNINSCRSMEKAGFELIQSIAKPFEKYRETFKENHYVLKKSRWNSRV
ncbi:GNAT family N-acetyltransferase [Bacillus sp. NEB1478]|uniref:GNAT family N-acetyltransferase n=1 Tax=Bacillus sp. NEB1478 TaxID=3073816 RepID=UPI002873598E|nr:GNAT family N-acetyltransferase [Bacillus sp. NEB1478]WNB91026.1 GNAT family N-acetyltransferase [Bacillus sp. NEB1478]